MKINGNFCGLVLNQPLGGLHVIEGLPLFADSNDGIASVAAYTYHQHSVLFIGTRSGNLKKVGPRTLPCIMRLGMFFHTMGRRAGEQNVHMSLGYSEQGMMTSQVRLQELNPAPWVASLPSTFTSSFLAESKIAWPWPKAVAVGATGLLTECRLKEVLSDQLSCNLESPWVLGTMVG